jgi:hypothetical protein
MYATIAVYHAPYHRYDEVSALRRACRYFYTQRCVTLTMWLNNLKSLDSYLSCAYTFSFTILYEKKYSITLLLNYQIYWYWYWYIDYPSIGNVMVSVFPYSIDVSILYIKMNVCLFVCLHVCLYLMQIHISEPIGTKLCTHLPLGLEETVGYVWARDFWPLRPFESFFFRGYCRIMGTR